MKNVVFRNRVTRLIALMGAVMGGVFLTAPAHARPDTVPPDSSGANPNNPFWFFRQRAPAGRTICIYPTHDGARIPNANGDNVRFCEVSLPPANRPQFAIPGIINGKSTTDLDREFFLADGTRVAGLGRFSIFDGGMMTANSIGKWLTDTGHDSAHPFQSPDFLLTTGAELFTGVDMNAMGNAGGQFIATHAIGAAIVLDAVGGFSGLPGMLFSAAPIAYVAGSGWTGAPLPPGTTVTFTTDCSFDVPAPGAIAIATCGGLLTLRRRRS